MQSAFLRIVVVERALLSVASSISFGIQDAGRDVKESISDPMSFTHATTSDKATDMCHGLIRNQINEL
jgi:hypothetical protein